MKVGGIQIEGDTFCRARFLPPSAPSDYLSRHLYEALAKIAKSGVKNGKFPTERLQYFQIFACDVTRCGFVRVA